MNSVLKFLTEGDQVTTHLLKEKWQKTLTFYEQLIEDGHQLLPIRFLIRHIIEKGYDNLYFPATSLFNLLISIPSDNKIDFSKTLIVEVDDASKLVKFSYTNWTELNRNELSNIEKAIRWTESCHLTEVCNFFDHFIRFNPEWENIIN